MHHPLPDQHARDTAIDIHHSCVVSAPAGSGKTGLLTQRVLTLLGAVKKPEEILCITFTRKAANEMKERVFDTLKKADKVSDSDIQNIHDDYEIERIKLAKKALAQSEKYEWDILNSKYRLRIITIDGFCKNVSSRLPFLSEMGVNAGIFDDATQAYFEAITLWVQDKISENCQEFKQLLTLFHGHVNRLTTLLTSLLAVRDQWLPMAFSTIHDDEHAKDYFENVIAQMVEEKLQSIQHVFRHYESEICHIGRLAANNLHDTGQESSIIHLRHLMHFPQNDENSIRTVWRPLCDLLLTKEGEFRKSANKNIGFPTGNNKEEKLICKESKQRFSQLISELKSLPEANTILHSIRSLPPMHFDEQQWQTLRLLIHALPQCVAYLSLVFAKYKKADFTEYMLSALRALNGVEGHIELQQKFDYQLNHILIDEFQDTSAPQLELLKRLTQEWQPDEGRSLFIVGDGMQSCYGFRNANVGIFLNMKDHGLPTVHMHKLDLSVNFRSSETIVNWVNATFSPLFPSENNASKGAVQYAPSSAFKASTADDRVLCEYFTVDKSNTNEKNKANAESNNLAVTVKKYKEVFPSESIAILAKNRAQFAPIVDSLNQHSISYIAIDIDPLQSKQHIIDLMSLCKVICDPSDRLAWIALLRSPWCALNFSDLHTLLNYDLGEKNPKSTAVSFPSIWGQIVHVDQIDNLSDDGEKSILKLRAVIQATFAHRQRRPLATTIETAWSELGGPCTLKSVAELAEISTLLKRIAYFEKAGTIDNWQEFNNDINKLYAQPESQDDNPVQLITMHKSKGLEFDTVFLPSLERTGRADNPELLYWLEHLNHEGESQFILSPIDLDRVDTNNQELSAINTKDTHSLSQFIREEKKNKADLEQMRLLYVACTRAKKRLHLSATLKVDENNELIKAPKNSLLSKIWPTLKNDFNHNLTSTYPNNSPITNHDDSDLNIKHLHTNNPSDDKKEQTKPYILRLKNLKLTTNTSSKNDSKNTLNNDTVLETRPETQPPHTMTLSHKQSTTATFNDDQFNTDQFNAVQFNNAHIDIRKEFTPHEPLERIQGVFFHRVLKHMCESNPAHWDQQTIEQRLPYWQSQLIQLGFTRKQSQETLIAISQNCNSLLNDKTALWVLNPNHTESACELSLTWKGKEKIVDRTFIDEGVRWIIDYKTARPNTTPIDQFCNAEKSRYEEQMQQYLNLLMEYDTKTGLSSNSRPLQYRTALYFPFIRVLSPY